MSKKKDCYSAAHALAVLQLYTATEVMDRIDTVAKLAERDGIPGLRPVPLSRKLREALDSAVLQLRMEVWVGHLEATWWNEILAASKRLLTPERLPLEPLLMVEARPAEAISSSGAMTPIAELFQMAMTRPQLLQPPIVGAAQEEPPHTETTAGEVHDEWYQSPPSEETPPNPPPDEPAS